MGIKNIIVFFARDYLAKNSELRLEGAESPSKTIGKK